MTDEKSNTEDQANTEDQVTENTVEESASAAEPAVEKAETRIESSATEIEKEGDEDGDMSESIENENSQAENVVTAGDDTTVTDSPIEDHSAGEAEEKPIKAKKEDDGRRWYSLRVISGKERKIKERMELEIERSGWTDHITQILVPTEKVYKIRQGKKVISERNILPGYILVEAIARNFSGEMVQAITGMPNVIHFLGRNNPIPMQQSEANRMLGKVDESQDVGESLLEPFIVGETVKIIDGPFNEFVGDIQEINDEKKKLKVIVKIFGRGTEVELNFIQVEKQA